MKIVLDGMGGDNAPEAIVRGAVEAAKTIKHDIYITGKRHEIEEELKKNRFRGKNIKIVDAEEVITMDDSPVKAIRRKTESSMVVGLNMVRDGQGDIFISGGNTGALVVGARMILGRIDGIDRPALASIYPCLGGEPSLLVDAGASSEAKAQNLLESGLMGSIYMEKVWGRENPRVGLVNLGTEESKGTSVIKDAYQKLKSSSVNFVGNVEARELPVGACEVIVCDGFVGNVILKLTEGVAKSLLGMLKDVFMQSVVTKLCYLGVKGGLRTIKHKMDSEEVGGAPLLGTARPVIKAHGSSKAKGIKNAIRQARLCVEGDLCGTMEAALAELQTDETRAEKSE